MRLLRPNGKGRNISILIFISITKTNNHNNSDDDNNDNNNNNNDNNDNNDNNNDTIIIMIAGGHQQAKWQRILRRREGWGRPGEASVPHRTSSRSMDIEAYNEGAPN